MTGHTIIIRGQSQRDFAKRLIDEAPLDAVVNVREATRNKDQNARMWAMLTDIAQAMPEGRRYTTDDWKAVFMNACGWEVMFLEGLDGRPFPAGFRSSKMTVRQMADLISYMQAYGDTHGVRWSEPEPENMR